VTIQIGGQAFRCTWREPASAERTKVWDFMAELYPPYIDYQAGTQREIPIILFQPGDEVDPLG
jgi:hypothetical protein